MATRLEIARQVVKASGDYDLVVDGDISTCVDNGVNWHINEGQKILDREFKYKKDKAWIYKKIVAGQSLVQLNRVRTILEVWVVGSDAIRQQLTVRSLDALRLAFPDVPLSAVTQGTPLYYTPSLVGLGPEQYAETANSLATAGMTDTDFLLYGNFYATDAIAILPPPDGTYTVEILANCFSKTLTSNTDVSFWSVCEPSLLVDAACLHIEGQMHRNSTGYNDKLAPLQRALLQLYHDMLEEESAGPPERFRMLARR